MYHSILNTGPGVAFPGERRLGDGGVLGRLLGTVLLRVPHRLADLALGGAPADARSAPLPTRGALWDARTRAHGLVRRHELPRLRGVLGAVGAPHPRKVPPCGHPTRPDITRRLDANQTISPRSIGRAVILAAARGDKKPTGMVRSCATSWQLHHTMVRMTISTATAPLWNAPYDLLCLRPATPWRAMALTFAGSARPKQVGQRARWWQMPDNLPAPAPLRPPATR
eukprot:COSAG02_NODE_116_length_35392_cov_302.150001_20_plen_226_part_00